MFISLHPLTPCPGKGFEFLFFGLTGSKKLLKFWYLTSLPFPTHFWFMWYLPCFQRTSALSDFCLDGFILFLLASYQEAASVGRSSSAVHLTDCLRRFRVPLQSASRYSQLLFTQKPSANRTPTPVIHILLFLQKGATELKILFGFCAWFLSCSSLLLPLSPSSRTLANNPTRTEKARALTKERELDFVTIHREQSRSLD